MSGSRLFYTLDRELRFLAVGDATLAYWGKLRSEVIGRRLIEVLPGAEETGLVGGLKEALQSLRPVRRKLRSAVRNNDLLDIEAYPLDGHLQVTFAREALPGALGASVRAPPLR